MFDTLGVKVPRAVRPAHFLKRLQSLINPAAPSDPDVERRVELARARIGPAVQTIGERLFLTQASFELLAQLRDRDVAGPPVAATQWATRPTTYRYKTLIERAKQLQMLASQLETAMLSALEKRDAEFYAQLKARQDVSLTQAGVRLQDLRVQQAQDGVTLATLQQQRAQLQQDHYQQLLNEGVSSLESTAISYLFFAADLHTDAAVASFVASGLEFVAAALSFTWSEGLAHTASGLSATGSGFSSLAAAASTTATVLSTFASYERRAQDWDFQRSLAQQDVAISRTPADGSATNSWKTSCSSSLTAVARHPGRAERVRTGECRPYQVMTRAMRRHIIAGSADAM